MHHDQQGRFMLMFTIGPVQSFIEAARKTEDLWMGSYIFSYLVATAMDEVKCDGVALIYPAIGNQSAFAYWKDQGFATPSFPNLFLAIGDDLCQETLIARAEAAENRVKTQFEVMAKCVLDKVFEDWTGTYVEKLYEKQITDFFDVYWVITERETNQSYGAWYDYTASSLAAIKNCRTFKQSSEFGRKCSLDGTREILHLKENESVDEAMEWWKEFAEDNPKYCRPKEALCAVSLTKRIGRHFLENASKFSREFSNPEERPRFPSTSEVSTAAFKEQLQRIPPALVCYKEFCQEVLKLKASDDEDAAIPTIRPLPKIKCPLPDNVDGEWLYEETWDPNYLKRYYNIDVSKQRGRIEHCKCLRSQLVDLIGDEPGKYYAVIALDADDMGERIREAKSRKAHEILSDDLIQYTKDARRIVEEEHLGKLTYAGGDDLLALVNLKDLLPMLKALREKFPKFTTISVGVCIAHNKMPLTDVLRHARRMEKTAKNIDNDKNAVGIALFKHSGNTSEVVTHWTHRHPDGDMEVLRICQKLMRLLDDNEVSRRFLYTFRAAVAKLIADDGQLIRGVPPTLIEKEFKRLINRGYQMSGKDVDEADEQVIRQTIALLPPRVKTFTNFLGFLEIINFIARESK